MLSWLWILLIGAAVLFLTSWVTYEIYNRHVLKLCRSIPSAQPYYPLLGNIPLFVCSMEKITENIFRITQEELVRGHRAVCFWIGPYPIVLIINPDDIKKVLNNYVSRGKEAEESGKYFTRYGLITSPVDHWKVTRRHLSLSFHPNGLKQLVPIFNSTGSQLVEDLSGHAGGAAVDLMPRVTLAALKNICVLQYGPQIMESVSNEHFENLRRAVGVATELMALRSSLPWLQNDTVSKMMYGKEIEFVKNTLLHILPIFEKNSVQREPQQSEGVKVNFGQSSEYGYKTTSGAMRELKERFSYITDQHIMDEMVNFFVTGSASMGDSISSLLLALACNPDIQDKVYEEIRSVVSDEEEITHEDIKKLTYLDKVVRETLRFFTVVPFTSRAPTEDVHLGGYAIPANKTTFLCLAAACLDAKNFQDPLKFDPDRFTTNSSSEYSGFMPFSRGPRNCVGKDYAMMFMKITATQVVRKYELSTDMDICNLKKKFTLTITSCDGYQVYLNKRDK